MRADVRAATGAVVQIGTLEVQLAARRPPAELPRPVFGFVGRTAEITAVSRAMADGHAAAQLTGPPGAGKTALAVQVAHALADGFPDGQIALDLHGHDGNRSPTAHELLGRVLRSLELPDRQVPADHAARVELYRATLAERRVLLLADDAATPAQVRDLLPGRGSFLIVSTRAVLDGVGATVRLGGLDGDAALAILRAARPDAPRAELDALVGPCAGLPLALRILAARLAMEPELPLPALASRLAAGGLGELAAGDRAVRTSFRFSYDRLPEPVRLTFRRCAALPLADLTADTAAVLTGLDPASAARALAHLSATHLLEGATRLRPHDLMRRYAAELLAREDPPGETAAARERLVAHYVTTLPADVDAARAWLAVEWDNLVVVAEHLAATTDPRLHAVADRIVSEHDLPTPWDGWRRIQAAALADAQRRDDPARAADLRVRLGIALRERRLLPEALTQLAGAEQLYRRAGDTIGAAGAVGNEAEVLRDQRDDDRAAERFTVAIGMLRDDPRPEAVESLGWAQHGLGDVRTGQGRPADALVCHRRALVDFRRAGNLLGQAWSWHGTGDALRASGRPGPAAAAYRRALDVHDRLGNVASAGWTQQNLAETQLDLGRPDAAHPLLVHALAAAGTRVDRWSQARARLGLGDVARASGDLAAADAHWAAGLAVLGDLDAELAGRLRARRATN